jgi:hypothetical protein
MAEPEKKNLSWKQRLKAAYDEAASTAKDTLDTLSVLVNEDTGKAPKDLTLKDRANVVYGKLGKTEWLSVAKDTAKDLTKKDELKRLAGTVIALPGGLAVYGAYRVAKHHKDKEAAAANENKKQKRSRRKKPAGPKQGA